MPEHRIEHVWLDEELNYRQEVYEIQIKTWRFKKPREASCSCEEKGGKYMEKNQKYRHQRFFYISKEKGYGSNKYF